METKKIEKDELSFGNQKIGLEIPKFTNVLIVTSISEATNGGTNVTTITYDKEQIKKLFRRRKEIMKRYKSKIMKIVNFIKNEGKFEFGDMVRVLPLKKDLGEENFYTKYIGLLGTVTSISYDKKDYIFGVKFEDGNRIDFRADELEKIKAENPLRYKKLNIQY